MSVREQKQAGGLELGLLDVVERLADPLRNPELDPDMRPFLDARSGEHFPTGRERAAGIPPDFLMRDLVAGTNGQGGFTIGSPRFGHVNAPTGDGLLSLVGVTPVARGLPGLPFISTPSTAAALAAEGDAAGQSEAVFGLRQAAPKTIGVRAVASRAYMRQGGPLAEAMVRRDMLGAVVTEFEREILAGSGNDGEASGLIGMAGVQTTAETTMTTAVVALLISSVLDAGARLGDLRAVMSADVYGKLLQTARAAGGGFLIENGRLLDVPVVVCASAPDGTLFIGAWRDLVVPIWGSITIFVDPYTAATSGHVKLRILADFDVLVPTPATFAAVSSISVS